MTPFRSGLEHWLPSRFLKASALFQAAGWPLVLFSQQAPAWLIEVLLLNHVAIAALGFWPQSRQLGPNIMRLPAYRAQRGEVALTFDDGPDPDVTPRVLDLLESHGATASFFCIGERAQRHPDLVRDICARGHRVENHSHRHRWSFALQGIASLRDDVRRAQDVLTHITGRAPVFFRAPFGIRNPWVEPILHSLDLHLVSWTRRGYDAVIGNPAIVGPLLTRGLQAGEIVLLHDGGGARNRQGGPVVLDVLPRLLDEMAHQGLVARSLGEGPFEEPPDVGD